MTLAQMECVESVRGALHGRMGGAVRAAANRIAGAADRPGAWPECCLPPTGWLDGGLPTPGAEHCAGAAGVRTPE